MPAVGQSEIREWFQKGVDKGAKYMLIVYDRMGGPDDFDSPCYYDTAEDAEEALADFGRDELSKVMEAYDLSLDMEFQLAEKRAWHLPGHKTDKERQADLDFSFAKMMADGSWPLYEEDEITPERMQADAAEYYQKAAENGHTEAALELGMMYVGGKGVVQDFSKAKELLEQAAEGKYSLAYELLSQIYWLGLGVEQDTEKATEWAVKAADNTFYCLRKARWLREQPDLADQGVIAYVCLVVAEREGEAWAGPLIEKLLVDDGITIISKGADG